MSEADRRSIAEMLLSELLGQRTALEAGGFCACPGVGMHTKGNGKRDFRVVLDGAPTGYCFHGSCSSVVEGFNKELRRRIWFAENGREARAPRHHWGAEVAAEPKAEARPNRPPLDHAQIDEVTRGCPEIAEAWVARRSAVDIAGLSSLDFLSALYREDERVLVFTDQRSQGDFIVWKKPAELGAAAVVTGYRPKPAARGKGGGVEAAGGCAGRGVVSDPARERAVDRAQRCDLPAGGRAGGFRKIHAALAGKRGGVALLCARERRAARRGVAAGAGASAAADRRDLHEREALDPRAGPL